MREKIDIIDRRLEEVRQLLRNFDTKSLSASAQLAPENENRTGLVQGHMSTTYSTPFEQVVQPASDSPVVEGESSLAAQSVFANNFLRNSVQAHSPQDSNLELCETLDSLHHIVNSLKQRTAATEMVYPNAKSVLRFSLRNYELPPIQKTTALIRAAKSEYI